MTPEQDILIPAAAQAVVAEQSATWRAALPQQRPYLLLRETTLPHVLNSYRNAQGTQKTLVDELRRVADDIVDEHWLRVYAHSPQHLRATRERVVSREPDYRHWSEFVKLGMLEPSAREELWQRDVGDNMPALALAALIFEDERYVVALKEHVLMACRYPTWGDMEGLTNMDLACAHLSRGIAVARDWLPHIWSEAELDLIRATLRQRLSGLLHGAYGAAYWHNGWQDNHCQNAIAALGICGLAFLDEIPEAPQWLGAATCGFEYIAKHCHADGSSHEGVPYWSYGMSFLLQYIETTRDVTGSDWLYETPYFQNAFTYRLQVSTPDLAGTLPFGDAVKHDYYGPGHILRALAKEYRNPHAQWLAGQIPFRQIGGADVEAWDLLWHDPSLPAAPPSLELDCYFPTWDVAVSRNGWQPDDYVLAIKSGHTNRNHSHLDAGAIVFAYGDEWLLTAPGYGKVGPGFWDANGGGRWEFYSNSTESHSTLLINGENQRFDREARGVIEKFVYGDDYSLTTIDLTGAYKGVRSVHREVLHQRNRHILITDAIELEAPGVVEWLLQPGTAPTQHNGALLISGQHAALEARMLWPPVSFEPRHPTRPHLDVPEERIHTHAVRQEGTVFRFVCLLAPRRVTNPLIESNG